MGKKIISILSFIFILFFLSSFNKAEATDAYITGCLRVAGVYRSEERCNQSPKVTVNNVDYPCLIFPDNINSLFDGKTDHVALIEGTGFPENRDIFIVGCISTDSGIKCTTGDDNLNRQVNDLGFTVADGRDYGYVFKAAENPTRVREGKVSVIVRSYTPTSQNHLFFGIAEVTQAEYGGAERTVQYGTFGFSEDPQKCISIRWDPRGRVFDSKSLEPLPNAIITLLNSSKEKVNIVGVENPVITKDDGLFNFFVPSGTYYLSPAKDNYEFPVEKKDINGNFRQIYYCDSKISYFLYNEQLPIHERNELLHCDVPLKPLGTPFKAEKPVAMEYGYLVMQNSHRFFGRFSHPLTIVRLTQGDKIINEITSDKFGNWEMTVSSKKIASDGGNLEIIGIKNPNIYPNSSSPTSLNFFNRLISLFFKSVFSQETKTNKIVLEPILRHLEGYTYDAKGEPIAYATVSIITRMNNRIFFQTQADEKGFFVIYSNQLPVFPYFIEFSSPANPKIKISTTTSQFLSKNKNYLEQNKINLISATKNNQLIATSSAYATPPINQVDEVRLTPEALPMTPIISPSVGDKKTKEVLIIVFILISLIFVAGSLIFYFWKKKAKEEQNFPPLS